MDTFSAFARGEASRGKPSMVFDWLKAAKLIRERKPKEAQAGLRGDWEYTGGVIFRNGKPVKTEYTYLASTWAVPELDLDGEMIPCFIMEGPDHDWTSSTKWPRVALAALTCKSAKWETPR